MSPARQEPLADTLAHGYLIEAVVSRTTKKSDDLLAVARAEAHACRGKLAWLAWSIMADFPTSVVAAVQLPPANLHAVEGLGAALGSL